MNDKERLRQAIRSLPPLSEGKPKSWPDNRRVLREYILTADPDEFQTWPVIVGTMLPGVDVQEAHLEFWEEKTGNKIADMESIVEFGGGYGNMIIACHNMGFTGKYYAHDFPELQALQAYYLTKKGYPVPEYINPSPTLEADLFIAIHSFTEAPLKDRDVWVLSNFKHMLVKSAHEWEGVDNVKYLGGYGALYDSPIKRDKNSFYTLL